MFKAFAAAWISFRVFFESSKSKSSDSFKIFSIKDSSMLLLNMSWLKKSEPWFFLFTFFLCVFLILYQMCFINSSTSLRTTSNRYLLINLAVSDVLKLPLNVPFKVVSNAYQHWFFGYIGTIILIYFDLILCYAFGVLSYSTKNLEI